MGKKDHWNKQACDAFIEFVKTLEIEKDRKEKVISVSKKLSELIIRFENHNSDNWHDELFKELSDIIGDSVYDRTEWKLDNLVLMSINFLTGLTISIKNEEKGLSIGFELPPESEEHNCTGCGQCQEDNDPVSIIKQHRAFPVLTHDVEGQA